MNKFPLFYKICLLSLAALLTACGFQPKTPTATSKQNGGLCAHSFYPLPVKGSIPEDWIVTSPELIIRGLPHEDPTLLAVGFDPDSSLEEALSSIESEYNVDLQVFECVDSGIYAWQCYQFVSDQFGIVALAPQNFGELSATFSLADTPRGLLSTVLISRPEETQQLYRDVLKPLLQSMAWDSVDPNSMEIKLPEPPPRDYWPTNGWQVSTPEAQGMDSSRLQAMLEYINKYDLKIATVTIIRHGYQVLDERFSAFELGMNNYSVTKSVTSALIGMALQQGKISSLDQPVIGFFPDREIANLDDRKAAMTVENLLTMQAGLDWPSGPFLGSIHPDYTTGLMEAEQDWVQFVLDKPMAAEPGSEFLYNSGASHLLSAIVQETTGMSAYEFAQQNIFSTLGFNIHEFEWESDPQGYTQGFSGLKMERFEMAKFGYLYLNRGRWEDEQILPEEWVLASTRNHVGLPSYGYQWWLYPDIGMFAAEGLFGQSIFVLPELDLVVVFTAHLDEKTSMPLPHLLLRLFILPAVQQYP